MIKSINLSYFNRYSCVCRRLEGNSSLSLASPFNAAVQGKFGGCCSDKTWPVLIASLLSNPLRDSLKLPTAMKTMNGELWSTVENRQGDEIMKKNKQF